MTDWYLLFTPLVLLPIALLLVFVGCSFRPGSARFVTLKLMDEQTNVSVSSDQSNQTISANDGDTVDVSVSTDSTTTGSVIIEQSANGSDPWTSFLTIAIGTSGGSGTSQFTITPGMPSFFLRANNGLFASNLIQVNTPAQPSKPIIRIQVARGTVNGTTVTVMLPANPANGNNLYAVIANQGSGQTVGNISQSGVSNWTKVASSASGNGQADVEIWKAENVSGASATVTITLSGTPTFGAVADVLEYQGLASNGTDQVVPPPPSSGSTSPASTGTTPATATAKELWLGAICSFQTATSGPTNGFMLIDGTAAGSNAVCSVLEKIVSATGAAGSGVTCNNNWWAGCIATFKGT